MTKLIGKILWYYADLTCLTRRLERVHSVIDKDTFWDVIDQLRMLVPNFDLPI
jgi:hypothetical protein